jgi:hypothetical protein
MFPIKTIVVALVAVAVATPGILAQTKRPDFSGKWQQDSEASKALTEKNGHQWRVGGAAFGGTATPPNGAVVMRPLTIITQSAAEFVIERRYEGEVLSREVFKLDGTLSINAQRNTSSRSTTVWKGVSLVTTGTATFDFSDGTALKADGTPIGEITRQFVTTRTLMPDGTMQVESRTKQDGEERVSWSVLVRVKPS